MSTTEPVAATIRETPDGWLWVETGRTFDTACATIEALRLAGQKVAEWHPCTSSGHVIVRVLTR